MGVFPANQHRRGCDIAGVGVKMGMDVGSTMELELSVSVEVGMAEKEKRDIRPQNLVLLT